MSSSCVICIVLISFYALVPFAHGLEYSDLETLGIACPKRDRCEGYKNDATYVERNCECDSACRTYKDCCIDVRKRPAGQSQSSSNTICLHYGENTHTGVYVISACSSSWKGPREVEQNCEGSIDLSHPVSAVPVTSISEAVTYKNLYCAECNNADMKSLTAFHFNLSCEGIDDMSQEQIRNELSYNQLKKKWGVYRDDAERNLNFKECQTFFDLPKSLRRSVRFCRANIISQCAADWTRPREKKLCQEYMAVVFDRVQAYRNPHCSICNHKPVSKLSCTTYLHDRKRLPRDLPSRKRTLPIEILLDISMDKLFRFPQGEDNIPQCLPNQRYDPFSKTCRRLVCALPRYVLRKGRCVPGK